MGTENIEKKSTLSRISKKTVFASFTIFILIALIIFFTLYGGGFGKYADVHASLFFDGVVNIAHGGYFKLNYEGNSWTEDFGSGVTPQCNFYHIKLKRNKKARIKVAIKNGLGVVTWTKEEDICLTKGHSYAIIRAKLEEIGE